MIDSEEVIISRIWDDHGKEVGYEQKGVLVRCKDCKHNLIPPDHGNACCDRFYGMTDQMGFCSYGERKE